MLVQWLCSNECVTNAMCWYSDCSNKCVTHRMCWYSGCVVISVSLCLGGGQSIQQPVPSPDKRGGLASGRATGHKTFAINRNAETVREYE